MRASLVHRKPAPHKAPRPPQRLTSPVHTAPLAAATKAIAFDNSEFLDRASLEIQGRLMATQAASEPHFAFAIISDIQHAPIEDGASFHGTPRYYRHARDALKRAVAAWKTQESLQFAVNLGDIVDGFAKDDAEESLDNLLDDFNELGKPVYHMLGNHCLYNLSRKHLNQKLGIHHGGTSDVSYYSFKPAPGWRIVVVDSYDVSILGWPPGHPLHEHAKELLAKNNPNENKNSPDGLRGLDRRWVQFGGGASVAQLAWIKAQLKEASDAKERVLVFSHLPFMPGSCPDVCLLWNYSEVLDVFRASGVVVATAAGHCHSNGYKLDEYGIHHMCLAAVLETPPGRDCYGSVHVFEDRLELRGVDAMMSLTLPIQPPGQQRQLIQKIGQLSALVK